jgi:transcriptional regulator with GAF, ATPase, and Fis domain
MGLVDETVMTPDPAEDFRGTREECLARTFVELADTLVDDFDLVEILALLVEKSVTLLDGSAAGVVVGDERGRLALMASTSKAMELVELFQVQNDEGPCFDCFHLGEPVIVGDLAAAEAQWPTFVPFAQSKGFAAAHAFPLRLRGRVLGAMNLFRSRPGILDPADVVVGQALTDIAAIAILQFRAARHAQVVTDQLQQALYSRVAIEQAKGMLAERAGVGMNEAFARLRRYARNHQRLLADVAGEVVSGALSPEDLAPTEPAVKDAETDHETAG